MHRCGTSAVAGALVRLGVDMGLVGPPQPDNPKGHWEDLQAVAINEELLKKTNGTWHAPPPPEAITAAASKLEEAIRSFWLERSSKQRWGWKDPRTVLTLPAWLKFKPAEINPRYLVVTRNPWAAAQSLFRRHGGDPMAWLALVGYHLHLIGRYLMDGGDYFSIQFETLTAEPEVEIRRLARWLGVAATAEAIGFIDPALDHQGGA